MMSRFLRLANAILICLVSVEAMALYSSDNLYSFAQYLEGQGEYQRSAVEYQRFVHYFPHDPRHWQAKRAAWRNCYYGENYALGIQLTRQWAGDTVAKKRSAAFYRGLFYYRNKQGHKAVRQLERLRLEASQAAIQLQAEQEILLDYYLFWIYLEQRNFERSDEYLRNITSRPSSKQDELVSQRYLRPLRQIDLEYQHYKSLPMESGIQGFIASALIPGLGQELAERRSDGIVSFSAVVLSGLLSALAWQRDEKGLALMAGSVSIVFYAGNIYGGYLATYRQSEIKRRQSLAALKAQAYQDPDFSW